jgi:hypothetical protein
MTIDEAKHRLLDDLFESIDEQNVDRYLRFLTDDAIFRFGSAADMRSGRYLQITAPWFVKVR